MSIQEACSDLYRQYNGRDWFHSIQHNNDDTIIVYTLDDVKQTVHKYYGYTIQMIKYSKRRKLK